MKVEDKLSMMAMAASPAAMAHSEERRLGRYAGQIRASRTSAGNAERVKRA